MDPSRQPHTEARAPLTQRARRAPSGLDPLIRPIRFDPPHLTTAKSADSIREEHARALKAVRAQADQAIGRHEAARAELESVTRSLVAAIERLDARDAEVLDQLQHRAVQFAVELAAELVGRELASCDDVIAGSLTRALQFVPERGEVVVRVNPADEPLAGPTVAAHVQLARRVEIVADPSVERGGSIVTVGPMRIDGQLGAAFARVRAELELASETSGARATPIG